MSIVRRTDRKRQKRTLKEHRRFNQLLAGDTWQKEDGNGKAAI